jgi:hypothetical protein
LKLQPSLPNLTITPEISTPENSSHCTFISSHIHRLTTHPQSNMSAQPSTDASKASETTNNTTPSKEQQKPAAALEEDDEFEDFPAEGTQHNSAACIRC